METCLEPVHSFHKCFEGDDAKIEGRKVIQEVFTKRPENAENAQLFFDCV